MPVIDAHQHFWIYDPIKDAWITDEMQILKQNYLPDDLHKELKQAGVDGTVVVQASTRDQENTFLIQLAQAHPFIQGVVGWVDPCSHLLEEQLQIYQQIPIVKGFRHIVQSEPDDYLLRKQVQLGIAMIGRYGFTYDILIYPRQLAAALQLVESLPEQPLVVDHLAKPLIRNKQMEPWASQIKMLAQASHVYCKLSGWATEADWQQWTPEDVYPYFDVIFDAFGSTRILFGSDWPVCLLAASYSQIKQTVEQYLLRYYSEAIPAVMGQNAIRFYRLPVSS
ncbi:amidohydrolase family protein [Thermoflavifilum thermophilum]|uniref:L-fuconolactonase n=1 Tax=Thermoflavifilum thermophilum TaxID=1393122 RepID=A0A1I7MY38_9BACT|nr:amidohydrolase family protein [Thermoflavifilum thermophilum]SFV27255.1 L-fuconolactonase [Thermoflavifilum thermophilum]